MKKISLITFIIFQFISVKQSAAQYYFPAYFAGSSNCGYSGDGGLATAAELKQPNGVAFDLSGNLYIADEANDVVREVNKSGIISTIAGNGNAGYSGDNGPATLAKLNNPYSVAVDDSGSVYISDQANNRIRKVNPNGIISTIAGDGNAGFSGDNGPATSAEFNTPCGVAADNSGNVYIADQNNLRIREVNSNGIISTFAGGGHCGGSYCGDGGTATAAELFNPLGVVVDDSGNVYIADYDNFAVRKVNKKTGIISTVAGNGSHGYTGDGGPATAAQLYYPSSVALDSWGNLFITDQGNFAIREVNTHGIISTVAGAPYPFEVAVDGSDNIYVTTNPGCEVYEYVICTGVVTINPSSTSVCSGQSISLTVPTSGTDYIWSPNTGLNNTTGDTVVATPIATITYLVIGFDSAGCLANGTTKVAVNPTPSLGILPTSLSMCNGDDTMLTVSGAINYSWIPSTGLSTTSGDSVIANPTTTTTYTVTGTNSFGCSAEGIVVVNINPIPTLTIQPASPSICNGEDTTLTASGASTYVWSPTAGLNSSTGSIVIADPTLTSTYTVTEPTLSGVQRKKLLQ